MKKLIKLSATAFLLSTVAFAAGAQEIEATDIPKPATVGGAVGAAKDAAAQEIKEDVGADGNKTAATKEGAKENKPKPGDDAPVILPPDFSRSTSVGRISDIGEDVMILQQDQKRLTEIKNVINQVGIENAITMYPSLASDLATSPIALEAQLARVRTLNELREEVAKANGPTEYERELAKEDSASGQGEQPQGGTDLMNMDINSSGVPEDEAQVPLTREDIAAIIEEEKLKEQQESIINNAPTIGEITITEIYGANGQMVALLSDGVSTYKVRAGDDLPQIGQVSAINRDSVTLMKDGQAQEIRFR